MPNFLKVFLSMLCTYIVIIAVIYFIDNRTIMDAFLYGSVSFFLSTILVTAILFLTTKK